MKAKRAETIRMMGNHEENIFTGCRCIILCIVEKIYSENFMILSVEVVPVIFVVVFVFGLDKGSYKLQLCVVELCCFVC